MAEVGYASLGIIPSFDGFQSQLERGTTPGLLSAGRTGGVRFGDAAGSSAGKRFGSVFSTAAKASMLGLVGAGALAVSFGKAAVSSASDLEESTNKVKQVFGDSADDVFKFTEGAADSLGQSNVAARDAASTFGIFGHAADLSDKKAAKFSKRMTILASDLASFHNTEPDEAVEALGAALRGESEPIRKYGVLLDDATLKAEALRLGLLEPVKDSSKIKAAQVAVINAQKDYNDAVEESGEKSLEALTAEAHLGTARDTLKKATEGTIPALTQQQKILAAQSSIFKQTEVAQGDFERTSDGLANQQRRLAAEFENTKAKLGEGLLPIVSDVAGFLLDEGVPAFEKFSDWFTKDGVPAIQDFMDDAKPLANEVLPAIGDALGTAKDTAKTLAPILTRVFDGFNKLPDWVQSVIVLGAGAAALKSKLGGGKSGLTGGLLGGISSLKPIPVVVTNPGFGAGVPGAGGKPGVIPGAAGASGPKVGIGFLAGLSLLGAASQPDTIDPEDQFGAFYESAEAARKAFKDMRDSGQYTAEQLEAKYEFFRKMFGEDFDYMSYHARQTMQKIQDATPRYLQTELVVNGVDEARNMVELALEPFMVGRNSAKEQQGADHMLPAPSSGRRTSSGGGVTINQNIGTVNDSKQLNKDAAAKAQQAAMGGWG